jgi:hypothetical protein
MMVRPLRLAKRVRPFCCDDLGSPRRVDFDFDALHPGLRLKPNMFAYVTFFGRRRSVVLRHLVPCSAGLSAAGAEPAIAKIVGLGAARIQIKAHIDFRRTAYKDATHEPLHPCKILALYRCKDGIHDRLSWLHSQPPFLSKGQSNKNSYAHVQLIKVSVNYHRLPVALFGWF